MSVPGDLPPVGARVRTTFGAEGRVTEHSLAPPPSFRIQWDDARGGMWLPPDYVAEVLSEEAPDAR